MLAQCQAFTQLQSGLTSSRQGLATQNTALRSQLQPMQTFLLPAKLACTSAVPINETQASDKVFMVFITL